MAKYVRPHTARTKLMKNAADKFCKILESIDHRCLFADGPVTPTLEEATHSELRWLYNLANTFRRNWKPAKERGRVSDRKGERSR